MQSLSRIAWAVTLGILLLVWTEGEACAHAFLRDTVPEDSSRLEASPPDIQLRFNEPVTPITVQVLDSAGQPVAENRPVSGPDDTVRLPLPHPLPNGTYTVSYRVTSADGHPAVGSIAFGVGAAPNRTAGDTPAAPEGVDAAAVVTVVARALHYGFLLAGLGGGLFLVLVSGHHPALNEKLRYELCWLLLVASLTAILLVGLNGVILNGNDLTTLAFSSAWDTGMASTAGISAVIATVGLLISATGLTLEADHGVAQALLVLGALLGTASLAVTGHAATAPPRWLSAPLVVLHGLMAAYWVGSFWPLIMTLRTEPIGEAARLTRRFSRLAIGGVALLIAAGAGLTVLQMPTPTAVLTTSYGQTWLCKMLAVGGLLALAALNRVRLTPALEEGGAAAARALRRSIGAEVVVAAVVLLITSAFALSPPPRTSVAPEPVAEEEEVVQDAGYATSVTQGDRTALIEVIPARAGNNRVNVHLSLPDGRPLVPTEATLELSMPGGEAAPLLRPLSSTTAGVLSADNVAIPVAGRWFLRLEAQAGDTGTTEFRTEVPIGPAD
ncbi:copper resistance CopC/CopD family protein [Azospirillum canadense]|uniref:copper resistance CopC/CopD family protein n=1 Tax=Azospirillum canadense TaxID=403962 RepID=UPI002226E35A|nr:copper resistance protein CopC [Azospirillum canadense]MCW2241479.1 copper transport protein [Azospirillum canadense]